VNLLGAKRFLRAVVAQSEGIVAIIVRTQSAAVSIAFWTGFTVLGAVGSGRAELATRLTGRVLI
jgi:hypothetical protein